MWTVAAEGGCVTGGRVMDYVNEMDFVDNMDALGVVTSAIYLASI